MRHLLLFTCLIFYASATIAQTISDQVVAWGDSLTAGAGIDDPSLSYPAVAASLLEGISVVNLGIGGQTSTEIAARMGAVPVTLTLGDRDGDLVQVKDVNPNILNRSGKIGGQFSGTYEGLNVILSANDGNITLKVDATDIPTIGFFVPDISTEYSRDPVWIWAGRNNFSDSKTVLEDIAAMVERIEGKPYFVLGILTAANDSADRISQINGINAELKRLYGKKFKDVLGYLLNHGDDSEHDQEDIERYVVPRSLRSDNVHLNSTGYLMVGSGIAVCWKTPSFCPMDM